MKKVIPMKDQMEDMSVDDSPEESVETPEIESSDYEHIDEFVNGLDKDELGYLEECLQEMKASSEETKEEKPKEKIVTEKDFED